MGIDGDEVGRAIATRSWRLAFPPDLEARFEADTADERCRRVIRQNYLGLAIYNAFIAGDWLLINDVFRISVVLHLCIMTPIMGVVILMLSRRPPAWLRESILAFGIVLATAAILGLMLISKSPLRSSEHLSVVLVILFATIVQRIRFPYVLFAGIASLGLYIAALSGFAQHEPARAGVAIAIQAGVVLFSLIGCYNLEYEQRMGYLLGLRDRLRSDELESLSRHDALTGLGNRRALDHAMAARQRTEGTVRSAPVAVLLIDIDFFKAHNDANGHLAGDICLQRVAAAIGGAVRFGNDAVFRFGGEEFIALLDGTSTEAALAAGERVRRAVEEIAIPHDAGRDGVVTVSIGVSVQRVDAETTLADIVAEADRALYAAKRGGRNQVRHFDAVRDGRTRPSRVA
ncbi:Diguanylate-cyclase [Beijerinckiaceae bacterium RH CH11]|nr:GGDEF domain-containing protein [Beijerinckiaceae bacterium]VVB46571.1 Diguanylate-cyclase [Beijerinckiaceae bacterium RH CH11]VVB46656.1 Diguanylate-cyclase [Beijerinckiaceae bacterium RH AL8]